MLAARTASRTGSAIPANPIIFPGKDQWDHDACYKPYAIFDGKKWLLWYNGRHGGLEQIGVVFHEGEDLGFDAPAAFRNDPRARELSRGSVVGASADRRDAVTR